MLCRLRLLYTGLYAVSARYTYCCALPFFRVEGLFRRRSGGAILLPCRQWHLGHPRWRRAAPCRSTWVGEGLAWDRAPAPPLWALLACIGKPGHRYAGVREELTTGFPRSRGLSRCPCARPRHCYLHNSCCIRRGVFLARFCRGARTCVSVFYPHGQSVRVKVHHQK